MHMYTHAPNWGITKFNLNRQILEFRRGSIEELSKTEISYLDIKYTAPQPSTCKQPCSKQQHCHLERLDACIRWLLLLEQVLVSGERAHRKRSPLFIHGKLCVPLCHPPPSLPSVSLALGVCFAFSPALRMPASLYRTLFLISPPYTWQVLNSY